MTGLLPGFELSADPKRCRICSSTGSSSPAISALLAPWLSALWSDRFRLNWWRFRAMMPLLLHKGCYHTVVLNLFLCWITKLAKNPGRSSKGHCRSVLFPNPSRGSACLESFREKKPEIPRMFSRLSFRKFKQTLVQFVRRGLIYYMILSSFHGINPLGCSITVYKYI